VLSVSHIFKAYPGLPVLHDVSFEVSGGEIVCLLGPSGAGKSTLLRIIAGLEQQDAGTVGIDGQDLAQVPVHRRHFGLMFQDFALFPHKDVFANVAFGLRMGRRPAAEIDRRVHDALALVRLAGYERRRVTELSGGEQQRVALARSLAPDPRLLMLDEPLGSLDRALREQLMNEVRAILKEVGLTALYVTHDQGEAFAIADRVLIMRPRLDLGEGGHIEQAGTPQEVYRQPATRFVAEFLGFRNLVSGIVRSSGPDLAVETPIGRLIAGETGPAYAPGDRVTILIRPEAARLQPPAGFPPSAGSTRDNRLSGRLIASSFRGSFYLVQTVHAGGVQLTWEIPSGEAHLPGPGEELTMALEPTAITVLATD
jgi:ABC-type Fe3+/spermidine/putrescine transport system ATPase subunit